MKEQQINSIAKIILNLLPNEWSKVVFHSIVDKDYYESIFYVFTNEKWIQCYDLPKSFCVAEDEIDDAFESIYRICEADNKNWSAVTFTITNDYKVSVDFEYGQAVSFDEWKRGYII